MTHALAILTTLALLAFLVGHLALLSVLYHRQAMAALRTLSLRRWNR